MSVTFPICTIFKANCISGCPCENYQCDETTTANTMTTTEAVITTINTESRLTTTQSSTVSSTIATTRTVPNGNAVFVLNSYSSSNKAMVVDFAGKNVAYD